MFIEKSKCKLISLGGKTMKKHSTKRALIASILSLTLCFSSLIGTTFAWFTDTVTSASNVIAAGNLDVELYHVNDKVTTASPVAGDTELFDSVELWEPGVMVWEKFTIENKGSLALKYQFTLNALEATVVDGISFASVLKVAIVDESFSYTREDVEALSDWTSLKSFTLDGELVKKGDTETFGVIIWWQPSEIDNVFNMNNGKTGDVSVKVGVVLAATQMASEEDGFGTDYDYDAPIVSAPIDRPDAPVTLKGAQNVMIELTQEAVDKLPADVESISISISEPKVDATANTITFATIELVDQDGEVIDLESLNLTEKITVTLPAQTVFAKDTPVMIYHDGEYVANAVVGENGVISYDVAHLCEVTVGAVEEPSVDEETGKIEIGSVSQLFAFAQSVNAGESYEGKTVVLTADIDLNNVAWTPIGNVTFDRAGDGSYIVGAVFKGTFDGQGHTVYNLYVSDPKANGVGFFGAAIGGAEIKNLKIKNVDITADGTAAAIVGYVCDYAKTSTIDNCHVSGDISIIADWAYVGGIAGYGHANISNCSVIADGTGVLVSENRNAVGGIMGWTYGSFITDCHVKDLNLTGWASIGGIVGYVPGGHTISGCNVENVVMTKTRVDGIASVGMTSGGWTYSSTEAITIKNNTLKNITFNGTYVANKAANVLYGSEYGGATTTNFVLENNTIEDFTNHLTEVEKVSNADELIEALEDENVIYVIFANDIKIDPANMSNAYGTTGINVENGQTIDGNGFTLDIKGAGGTWDSGINTTGGLIKNLTVTGSFRGIFINHNSTHSQPVVLENVIIDGTTYTISCDQGMNQTLIATNCTFNGWTSYAATLGNAKFVNCTFGEGNGYAFCRPYAPTEFVGCVFEAGYEMDPLAAVSFENCTLDGEVLTASNVEKLVTYNSGNIDKVNGYTYVYVNTQDGLVKALADGKETIVLAAGTYEVDLYNIAARDTLIIKGQGADTKLKFKNLQVRASQFKTLTIDNCTIERMPDKAWGHLVFGSSAAAGGVYTVSNCIFNGVGSQGIYVNQTVAATFNIENCTFNGDFGGEGAITVQNNDGVNITLNVTDCEFNSIPETSHEIYILYAYAGWTLDAEGVDVFWKTAQP